MPVHSRRRIRSSGGLTTAVCNFVVTHRVGPTQTFLPAIGMIGTAETMEDFVTPNFRSLVASGSVINNPMSRTKDSITRSPKSWNRYVYNTRESDDIRVVQVSAAPIGEPDCSQQKYGIDIDRLISLACTRALGNIAPPDATSLLTLGEFAETVALLRNPVSALTSAFQKLIRLRAKYWRLKAAGLSVEAIASQYLAVMFGMKPLLNDIQMFWNLLSRYTPPRRTSRAKFEEQGSWSERKAYSSPFGQPLFGETLTSGTMKAEVSAGSFYQYELQDDYSSILGVRLSDVPIAVWQLTGMSFVVDWAFNVSSFIKAFTPVAGVHRLAEWYTVRTEVAETVELSTLTHPQDPTWTGSGGGDTVTRIIETYSRHPCNLGEYVGLHSNIAWSPTKTLLSLSLLTQAVAVWSRGKNIPLPFHRG